MVPQEFTYAKSGVDRILRANSKKALQTLEETYKYCRQGGVIRLPFGNIFALDEQRYLDLAIEGVGTKVLVAQLARKYDTIGIDGVAMAVNDVIRSGAKPLATADNIHAQISNPELVRELLKGIAIGAAEARCVVPSGEIGDVSEIVKGIAKGTGFDLVVSSVGEVTKDKTITGRNIRQGDAIIGLRSSGLHSNGISLARRVLFRKWGGKYEPHEIPEGLDRELIFEVLEPTNIYAISLQKVIEKVEVKAAVHITGDGYGKFGNLSEFSKRTGFEFDNFKPQAIFGLIQRTAVELKGSITDEEMFRTFNMGWGFALIVDRNDNDEALDILTRSGTHAEQIGQATGSEGTRIHYAGHKIALK